MTLPDDHPHQLLPDHPTKNSVRHLIHRLTDAGTLTLPASINGLYAAATGAGDDFESSGYHNAWLRDNVQIAAAQLSAGDSQIAVRIVQQLTLYFSRHRARFVDILEGRADPTDPMQRPHVRFDAGTLQELPEQWAHAQNDALGYFLWISCRVLSRGLTEPSDTLRDWVSLLLQYWQHIAVWQDEDSGHWEEIRHVSASSIGCVLAGLRSLQSLSLQTTPAPLLRPDDQQLDSLAELISKCDQALRGILPWECRQDQPGKQRRCDASLLFLIFPLNVVQDRVIEDQILQDVAVKLTGPYGIRRYNGDSYWCADYRDLLSTEHRTADFSDCLADRDKLLRPGMEAQWCLFDPIISCIHGQRYLASGLPEDRQQQIHHLRRSLQQLSPPGGRFPAWRCPESWFCEQGVWQPNDLTPLLWTQQNLLQALKLMLQTAESESA